MKQPLKQRIFKLLQCSSLFRKYWYYRYHDIGSIISEFGGNLSDAPLLKKLLFRYGLTYQEFYYYGATEENASSFITDIMRESFYNKLNKKKNLIDFDNKYRTYQLFGADYHRKVFKIENKDEFYTALEELGECIYKPLAEYCGHGIRVLSPKTMDERQRLWEELRQTTPFIVEEKIVQSETMAALHPQSVNTIRMATFLKGKASDYSVQIYYPLLKVGSGNSIVDNAGSGGFLCSIDKNGVVSSDGVTETNRRVERHPDTGIVFKGYQLPDWQQAEELVTRLAKTYPGNRYIGWDIAHTKDYGWCVVEANARGQLLGFQIIDQIGKKAELEAISREVRKSMK